MMTKPRAGTVWPAWLLVCAVLSVCHVVSAESGGTPVGPDGGSVGQVFGDPSTPGSFYAGSAGGLFRSTDSGRSWVRTGAGLSNGQVSVLAVEPRSPFALYVLPLARGGPSLVYRSADHGATFHPLAAIPTSKGIGALEPDPSSPGTLLVGTNGDGVFRSMDGGLSWTPSSTGLVNFQVVTLFAPPRLPGVVLLTTPFAGIFRSSDGGRSWAHVTPGINNLGARFIGEDAAAPAKLWAAAYGHGVLSSTDGGLTWRVSGDVLGFLDCWGMTTDPVRPGRLYVTSQQGGLFRSTDEGATWRALGPGLGISLERVAVDSSSPDTLAVAARGGVRLSQDGGESWELVTRGLSATVVTHLAAGPGGSVSGSAFVVAATPTDLLVTDGVSGRWRSVAGSLLGHGVSALAVDPRNPSNLWASGVGERGGGIARTTDGGLGWSVYDGNLKYANPVTAIVLDAADERHLWAAAFGNSYVWRFTIGGLYESWDGGATWQSLPAGGASGAFTSLIVDPGDSTRLWAGQAAYGPFEGALFRSVDAGRAWKALPGVPDRGGIDVLAFDPGPPRRLWAAGSGGLFVSTDEGESWTRSALGSSATALAVDPRRPGVVYACNGSHVYRSQDGGARWDSIGPSFEGFDPRSLVPDPSDANILYVGTSGDGVWAVDTRPAPVTATLSGDVAICEGDVAVLSVVLTGTPPWRLTWSDGLVQTVEDRPARRVVSPRTTTVYTLLSVEGAGAPGVANGAAAVTVRERPTAPRLVGPTSVRAGEAVTFRVDEPGGSVRWSASAPYQVGASPEEVVVHPERPGAVVVQAVVTDVLGCSSLATTTVVTVTSEGGSAVAEWLVPVVVDAAGKGGVRFSTELTVVNRGGGSARAHLVYTGAPRRGTAGNGVATLLLPPGAQRTIDVAALLREAGASLPAEGTLGGTLRLVFEGLASASDGGAVVRVTSPSGPGRAGVSFAALRPGALLTSRGRLAGLTENHEERTNLGLVNAGLSGRVTLRISLFPDRPESDRPAWAEDVTLEPGEWTQLDSILGAAGIASGWAVVERISGNEPFWAYAVRNDNLTNDGSYVAAIPEPLAPQPLILPVVVEAGPLETELVLSNPSPFPAEALLSFTDSLGAAGAPRSSVVETLRPFEQRRIPSAVSWLRERGLLVGPRGPSHAGSLRIECANGGAPAPCLAQARTAAARYGVAYAAEPYARLATDETWVFGLRQDAESRTNLAVAAEAAGVARVAEGNLTLEVTFFDATGLRRGTRTLSLASGEWRQLDGALLPLGLSAGYARVRRLSGTSRFLAYAVVNDGAAPGAGTGDGSFVPMEGSD